MPKSKEFLTSESDSGTDDEPRQKKKKVAEKKPEAKPSKSSASKSSKPSKDDYEEQMFEIGRMRFASVSVFKGKKYVNIREYYNNDDGERKPGKKGIALTEDQWASLKKNINKIDDALAE